MPTITTVALDTLLRQDTTTKDGNDTPSAAQLRAGKRPSPYVVPPLSRPYYFCPALYATPKQPPLPDSPPVSDSPSPYLLNHKRRGPRSGHTPRPPQPPEDHTHVHKQPEEDNCLAAEGQNKVYARQESTEDSVPTRLVKEEEQQQDDDDFFSPQESVGLASGSEAEDAASSSCHDGYAAWSKQSAEFYDADDDFFFDGSISRASPFAMNIKAELHALRLNLSEEIEKRKKAEEALHCMQNQWKKMGECLSRAGLPFPHICHAEISQFDMEMAEVCQEIIVARFVAEAVARGLAQAEAETAAETIIDSKNHEISRLRDRIEYYEAVIHEISQRNQEVIEHARQQRMRRKSRRKWVWGSITLSITVGASLLAYSLLKSKTSNASTDTFSGIMKTREK